MSQRRHFGIAAALAVTAMTALIEARPPKTPATVAATVEFRCAAVPGDGPCGNVETDSDDQHDRARSDGDLYTGTMDGTGLLLMRLTPSTTPGREFNLFLGSSEEERDNQPHACVAAGNCNAVQPGPTEVVTDFDFRVKPLTADGRADLPGGLYALSCGAAPQPGLVHFTFWLNTSGATGHWGLNFNPKAYDSDPAALVRVSRTTWTAEATGMDVAELVSFAHSGIKGNKGPSREGHYRVPFKVILSIAALPSGAGTGGCL